MADTKYGEVYTEEELITVVQMAVVSVLEAVSNGEADEDIKRQFTAGEICQVARNDIDRKFSPGEPLFILRGQDKRALGAVRWYRDHQWPSATQDHLSNIDKAVEHFEAYRQIGPVKEPD